jgi:hypothetical protein
MTAVPGPQFSPSARLAEIRLRIEGVGIPNIAALLVEGRDDKRIFVPFAIHHSLIIVCDGRTRLLRIYGEMTESDHMSMLPVTDCDYEVALETLKGSPDIVITENADVEADLLRLGLLERVIHHLLPREVAGRGDVERTATDVLRRATDLSEPLGRARMAAQPLGYALALENFRFGRHRLNDGSPDVDKIVRTVHNQIRDAISLDDFRVRYRATPDEPFMCKGNDLMAACSYVLREDFRARISVDGEMLDLISRVGVSDTRVFEDWPVCKRIRRWEKRTGRNILIQ